MTVLNLEMSQSVASNTNLVYYSYPNETADKITIAAASYAG